MHRSNVQHVVTETVTFSDSMHFMDAVLAPPLKSLYEAFGELVDHFGSVLRFVYLLLDLYIVFIKSPF
jgi:hypothetical protein